MNVNLPIDEYESIMNLIYVGEENIDLAVQILVGYPIDVKKFLLKEFGSLIVLKQSYVNQIPLYKIVEALKWMTKTTQILSNSTAKNITIPPLQSPTNKWHWVVFGADQYLHAIVIILMAWLV
jgi:hypothetical protein